MNKKLQERQFQIGSLRLMKDKDHSSVVNQEGAEINELKIKELEAVLEDLKERHEGVMLQWQEFCSHECGLAKAVESIGEGRMGTGVYTRSVPSH